MKKNNIALFLIVALFLSVAVNVIASHDGDDLVTKYILVHKKDGKVVKILVDDVDSIDFEADTLKIDSVRFSAHSLVLDQGATAQLSYAVYPDTVEQYCRIENTDPSVAQYDKESGVVTAVSEGTAALIAVSVDSNVTDTCYVTVTDMHVVEKVEWSASSLVLENDETATLTCTVSPSNANQSLSYQISNGDVISYDASTNTVTALDYGEATVIAFSADYLHSDTCYVTVKRPAVQSITFSEHELTLEEGDKASLTCTVLPEEADQDYTVKILNSGALYVNYNKLTHMLTAENEGSATLVATAADGLHSDTCLVTVTKASSIPVSAVYLSDDEISFEASSSEKKPLRAVLAPEGAEAQSVEWTSSNSSIAEVTQYEDDKLICLVKGVRSGTATVTVTVDNQYTASCKVTVYEQQSTISVTSVSISRTSLTLDIGASYTLSCTVLPSDATNKSCTWKSSNTSVATVSNSGVVTAVSAGTATITVTTSDGGKTASCNVTVNEAVSETVNVTSVEMTDKALTMNTGGTRTLTYTIYPSDATNQNVTWTTSDAGVVTVSSSGYVTAKKAGTATITVKTSDGGYTDQCVITVEYVQPTFATISSSVTATTATVNTTLSGDVSQITDAGVEYSLSSDFSESSVVHGSFSSSSATFPTYITGLTGSTTYYYRVYFVENGTTTYSTNSYSFTTKSSDPFPVAKAVDLGLPSGLKWSSWNMGATEVGEYGGYYCWGDASGEATSLSEYNKLKLPNTLDNIAGNAKYDIGTAQWGSTWRLPYISEFQELFNYCSEELIEDFFGDGSNVVVKKLTGPNGNYIYLPRGGYYNDDKSVAAGIQGHYWTAETQTSSTHFRYYYTFTTKGNNWYSSLHGSYRLLIRPVCGDYINPDEEEEDDTAGETTEAGEAVDLGISVRWATCNVGAANKQPSSFGDYYAWGESETKSTYTLDNYVFADPTDLNSISFIGNELPENFDVACNKWGGKWRMPTDDEWNELRLECTWQWATVDGVNGYKVYGKGNYSNNYIFLPAAGYKTVFSSYDNEKGYYWSSSLYSNQDKPYYNIDAWNFSFSSSDKSLSYTERYIGHTIRPVKP